MWQQWTNWQMDSCLEEDGIPSYLAWESVQTTQLIQLLKRLTERRDQL